MLKNQVQDETKNFSFVLVNLAASAAGNKNVQISKSQLKWVNLVVIVVGNNFRKTKHGMEPISPI
jgi:hypothetical protein